MNAPLKRDKQIELMKDAAKRHENLMRKWMNDTTVRNAVSRPTSKQKDHSDYSRNDLVIARCG